MKLAALISSRVFTSLVSAAILTTAGLLNTAHAEHSTYKFRVVHGFAGLEGRQPIGGSLALDDRGNLLGANSEGGTYGCGTVFRSTPKGDVTVLHQFQNNNADDGCQPQGGLIRASDGKNYGVSASGGAHNLGAVYSIADSGEFAIIHSFGPGYEQGFSPLFALTEGTDGLLYGATEFSDPSGVDGGIVYSISKSGDFRVVHRFQISTDRTAIPSGSLAKAADGTLYGITSGGDSAPGSVYSLSPDGVLTYLHRFSREREGDKPSGAVLVASDGTLFGTTNLGGRHNRGTVFSLSPQGTYRVLAHFDFDRAGWWSTDASLLESSGGSLIGATYYGGKLNGGVLFSVSKSGGKITPIHSCDGTAPLRFDCDSPSGGLIVGPDGRLYGFSEHGGNDDGNRGVGALFSLEPR